jgi:excisionase family DNA binding protein
MANPPKLYTADEAAAILRISRRVLLNLKRAGAITCIQVNRRVILFEQEAIEEYLEKTRLIAGAYKPPHRRMPG